MVKWLKQHQGQNFQQKSPCISAFQILSLTHRLKKAGIVKSVNYAFSSFSLSGRYEIIHYFGLISK